MPTIPLALLPCSTPTRTTFRRGALFLRRGKACELALPQNIASRLVHAEAIDATSGYEGQRLMLLADALKSLMEPAEQPGNQACAGPGGLLRKSDGACARGDALDEAAPDPVRAAAWHTVGVKHLIVVPAGHRHRCPRVGDHIESDDAELDGWLARWRPAGAEQTPPRAEALDHWNPVGPAVKLMRHVVWVDNVEHPPAQTRHEGVSIVLKRLRWNQPWRRRRGILQDGERERVAATTQSASRCGTASCADTVVFGVGTATAPASSVAAMTAADEGVLGGANVGEGGVGGSAMGGVGGPPCCPPHQKVSAALVAVSAAVAAAASIVRTTSPNPP